MDSEPFSKRYGHNLPKPKEITVREDAPDGLRGFIIMAYYDLGKKPSDLRWVVCRVLKTPPDQGNWSEFPNIDNEVQNLIYSCEWFRVYDIIEAIISDLTPNNQQNFEDELNEFFIINGIGWKIVNGLIETRGDEMFETTVESVQTVLKEARLPTAMTEITEALSDLSRRPQPDITGAIQHSLACLECTMREVTGDKNSTLGELIKKYQGVIPAPLDQAVSKIWGYSSEQGRHLREGQKPEYIEAVLVVEVTAAIASYLGQKRRDNNQPPTDDLPF